MISTSMNRFILSLSSVILSIVFLCFTGCTSSSDSEQSIYDTVNNPDGFPNAALTLLKMIESNQLTNYDQILAGFGDLYMAHSDLLDNVKWRATVDRLGTFLNNRAEKLVLEGPEMYLRASDYYRIALLSKPDDTLLQNKVNIFRMWSEASGKGFLDRLNLTDSVWSVEHMVDAISLLVPDDQYARQFIHEYLVPLVHLPDKSTLWSELNALNL